VLFRSLFSDVKFSVSPPLTEPLLQYSIFDKQKQEGDSMDIPSRYIWITEHVHPPEADRLADAFRVARACILRSASETDRTNSTLSGSWEGNQAVKFLDSSRIIPSDMRAFSDWCGSQENKFRAITVAIQKQILNPAYSMEY
jgi:hypothetical protein